MDIETGVRPYGATHWSPAVRDESRLEAYWRPDGKGGYDCWAVVSGTGGYWQQIHAPLPLYAIALSKPWTGEGLPPARTVCEHRTGPGMNWSHATVLAHGEKKVFYRDRDGHEWSRLYDEIEFRPIRTPEQIAAEEKSRAINIAMRGLEPFTEMAPISVVEHLYDAGLLRKPTDQ